jgi:hypothetical protein
MFTFRRMPLMGPGGGGGGGGGGAGGVGGATGGATGVSGPSAGTGAVIAGEFGTAGGVGRARSSGGYNTSRKAAMGSAMPIRSLIDPILSYVQATRGQL